MDPGLEDENMTTSKSTSATTVRIAPPVGTPCYFWTWTDRYPGIVTEVSPTGHRVTVRQVQVVRWTPHPDCRGVEFADDGTGRVRTFTRRRNGTYREQGADYGGIKFGAWEAYSDPHF
jgi:hypothetical protein